LYKIVCGCSVEAGDNLFLFEERNTLASAIAKLVETRFRRLLYNHELMLDLHFSPPNADDLGKSWVAKGIEEFNNGEWVAELAQLHFLLGAYQAEQKKKDGAIKIKRERFSKSSGNGNTVTVLAALTTFRNLKLEAVLQYAV
jgi:hypothetical protein